MIVALYGKDGLQAHEALEELRAELDGEGMLADNTMRLDATVKPEELLAHCQTVPMLGGHRLIIVSGLLDRFEPPRGRPRGRSSGARGTKALEPWRTLLEALPDLPESTVLVFLGGDVSATNPLLKALKPVADVRGFDTLRQNEVAPWVSERAKKHGLALEARAVPLLASLVGNNLWTMDRELEKLAIYARGDTVSEDEVRNLVSLAREPNIFAMGDALIEGRTREALSELKRLLQDGEPAQRLLVMVARQYRLLILTKELQAQGVKPPQMTSRLGVQGFVVQRLLKAASSYSLDRLRGAYRKILEADLSVKRGIFNDEAALELLLVELAALPKRATGRSGRPGYSRPRSGPGRAPSKAARR